MLSKLVKFVMWSTGIVATAMVLMLLFVSNFNGYCDELGRVTTDRELLLSVVEANMNKIRNPDGEMYDSAVQFLELNPNCCRIYRGTDEPNQGVFDRFIGWYIARISISNPKQEKPVTIIAFIDECGMIREQFG